MNNLDFILLTLLTGKKALFCISSICYVVENHLNPGCMVCFKEDPDGKYAVKESIRDIRKVLQPDFTDIL